MLFRSIANLVQKAMAAVRGDRIKAAPPVLPKPAFNPATIDSIGPEESAPIVTRWQKMMHLGRATRTGVDKEGRRIRSRSPRRKKPHLPRFKARYGNGGYCKSPVVKAS